MRYGGESGPSHDVWYVTVFYSDLRSLGQVNDQVQLPISLFLYTSHVVPQPVFPTLFAVHESGLCEYMY